MVRAALPLYRRPEVIAALVGLTAGIEIALGCRAYNADQAFWLTVLSWVEFLGAMAFALLQPPRISVRQAAWAGIGCHLGGLLTAMGLEIKRLGHDPVSPIEIQLFFTAVSVTIHACLAVLAIAAGAGSGLALRGLANLTRNGIGALTRFLKGAPQRP